MIQKLWEIFWAFLKPGLFGFGGGQATIPLIEAEVVDRLAWLTPDEFANFYAMGNTLPGPIATKMSIIIGFDVGGGGIMSYLGAAVALFALLLPSSVGIIVFFNVLLANSHRPFVIGMQVAAKPAVVALIGGVVYSMARTGVFRNMDFSTSKTLIVLGIFVGSTILVLLNEYNVLSVHPALMVIVALLIGGFFIR